MKMIIRTINNKSNNLSVNITSMEMQKESHLTKTVTATTTTIIGEAKKMSTRMPVKTAVTTVEETTNKQQQRNNSDNVKTCNNDGTKPLQTQVTTYRNIWTSIKKHISLGAILPTAKMSTRQRTFLLAILIFIITPLTNSMASGAALAIPAPGPMPIAAPVPGAASSISILQKFTPNCTMVSPIFQAYGISVADIPQKPSEPEIDLRYCESPTVGTCCTHNMETRLAIKSRQQLEKHSKDQIIKMTSALGAKAQKFNEDFRSLLIKSKEDFHNMFTRTYGVIYQQNSYVFSDLFKELENYYIRGRVNLIEVMDNFFNVLYQKMFQVLNAQYTFDENYLQCVSKYMKELKPFGDVPEKLSVQIKRSFVATRTYAQALSTAVDVAKKLVFVRINGDCGNALTKMQHCGVCKGYLEKPCTNYCINVIKGCLHYLNEFHIEWENFVIAMDKLGERLLGSFNIVMVVEPINIKISEAIMNFQDAGQDIRNRVFQGCGYPSLGRTKRAIISKIQPFTESKVVQKRLTLAAIQNNIPFSRDKNNREEEDTLDIDATLDEVILLREKRNAERGSVSALAKYNSGELSFSPTVNNASFIESPLPDHENMVAEMSNDQQRKRKNQRRIKQQQQHNHNNNNSEDLDYNAPDTNLDKMIRDIRQRVKESKKFWSNIPQQICSNEEIATTTDAEGMCWNGHTIDRYMHPVITEHGSNPEFPTNPASTKQIAQVATQLYYLKNAISHLRNAYNGQDIDWKDEEDSYFASGAGSGGGIDGDDENDTERDDDEDDDEDNNHEIGSGTGSDDHHHRQHTHHLRPAFVPIHKTEGSSTGLGAGITGSGVRLEDTDNDNSLGGGIGGQTTTRPKYGLDDGDHNHADEDDSNDLEHYGRSKSNSAGGNNQMQQKMSLRRALLIYLLPLYMTWFGGICNEFL